MSLRNLAAVLTFATVAYAEMYDVVSPKLRPPAGGCKAWSDVPEQNKYWRAGKAPADAGSFCAQQGKGNPAASWESDMGSGSQGHYISAYCVSARSGKLEQCTSPQHVPEQVNVQIASPDTVVISWVTFEDTAGVLAPIVNVTTAAGESTTFKGVTHKHLTAGKRVYMMHFVKVSGLSPKAKYSYSVKSGHLLGEWSDTFSFRAPYDHTAGPTKIALYGDMGVYTWNNMENLHQDTVGDDATMDLIIHAGDHCYNEGDGDEKRADAYMQAFEKTIANVPWMPIVGNHEFYAGTKLSRYLDSTWDKWGPLPGGEEWGGEAGLRGATSATSALGALLSAGNHHAAGVHGAVPSNTSRYFSVNFGQTHLVGLSLNGYNGVDTCTTECNEQQKEWLKADLAAVDRTKTPWVIAMSHFPMYLSEDKPVEDMSQEAWYTAEACEYEGHNRTCDGGKGWKPGAQAPKPGTSDLEPIFYEYGVDIYWAGHIHYYQTFNGPIRNGKVVSQGTYNPKGVIHVCTGNGGPPSPSGCPGGNVDKKCIKDPYSYTRLTVYNATDLLWEQVSNKDSSVIDSWTVHQDHHGKFP